MILGTISTVTAIALAHVVSRPPSSKDVGWEPLTASVFEAGELTDTTIALTEPYSPATSNSALSLAATPLDRTEWIKAELLAFGSVSAGWDGEGSIAPDMRHVDAAQRLLDILPAGIPLPKPMLSADGEIGLYWQTEDYLADAVIEDDKHFSLFIRLLKDGNPETYLPAVAIQQDSAAAMAAAFSLA